ncbi:hypothetical protein O3P69_014872 [Scylla paramamosain]|uniref:Cuticle protein n=1 Tax=Scylla paramamosain TaxID=85552 RepID=A0AAW0U2V6_SCYPA
MTDRLSSLKASPQYSQQAIQPTLSCNKGDSTNSTKDTAGAGALTLHYQRPRASEQRSYLLPLGKSMVSAVIVALVMVVVAAPVSSIPQNSYQNVQVSAVIVALVMVVVAAPVSSFPQNSYQNVQVSAVIVALVMVVVAAPVSSIPQNSYQNVQPSAPAQYSYNYGVNDDFGNNFGHGENRQGDNTDGAFSVVLPDGRRQSVEYSVSGDSGFLANVQYDGQAQFPQARPQYSQQAVEPVRPQYA